MMLTAEDDESFSQDDTAKEVPKAESKTEESDAMKTETPGNAKVGEKELVIGDEIKKGVVQRWKGTFGFITVYDDEGKPSNENVFVHKKNVISDDLNVFLRRTMEVQFKIATEKQPNKRRAVEVRSIDGTPLNWHKKNGEGDKYQPKELSETFFEGRITRNFFYRRNYGWISPLEKIEIPEKEILIEPSQSVYCCIQDLHILPNEQELESQIVEFKVYKDKRGIGAAQVRKTGKKIGRNSDPINEGQRFKGTVMKCLPHNYIIVKPSEEDKENVAKYTNKDSIWCSCYEINTDARPARVDENSVVSFQLIRDFNNIKGINVCNELGDKIVVESDFASPNKTDGRKMFSDNVINGSVVKYNWNTGVGWIEPKNPLDEKLVKLNEDVKNRKQFEDESSDMQTETGKIKEASATEEAKKEEASTDTKVETKVEEKKQTVARHKKRKCWLYFHRDDLKSEDKCFGVAPGTEVEFKIYTDTKGVGAEQITYVFGAPLSGFKRPKREYNNGFGYNRKRRFGGPHRRGGKRRKFFRGRGRGRGFGQSYVFPPSIQQQSGNFIFPPNTNSRFPASFNMTSW